MSSSVIDFDYNFRRHSRHSAEFKLDHYPQMSILVPALGVAFAGFCVWLAVRVFNRRDRWAKWTAAGLAACLPVVYVLPGIVAGN